MSATKTIGFVVLIGVGIYAVWFFLSKKVEAAEDKAASQIESISAGLKSSVAGVAASIGTGLKSLVAGKTASAAVGGAGTAASAAKFVGPIAPKGAALGMGTEAGAGALSGMTTGGIVAGAAVVSLWLYTAFKKLFPSKDPEWEAIERKLQEAKAAGQPIVTVISKAQLKAPARK